MRSSLRLLVVLAAALLGGAPAPESEYLIKDLTAAQRIDYLIIADDKFVDGIDALAAYRAKQGYEVGITTVAAVTESHESIRKFLAHAVEKWTRPAPTFLLLVGDVDTVPTVVRKGGLKGWKSEEDLATDFAYACPLKELEPLLHVGRFPCDTAEELAIMVRKTIHYETKLAAGAWQKRISFITGEAGFNKKLDAFIEKMFTKMVAGGIPPAYDIEVAYANTRSVYCPYPPDFHDNSLRLLNEGSLFYVFVGHGHRNGVDVIRWKGKPYTILKSKDADALDVKSGLPIMMVIACNTGEFDHEIDCVGEFFVKKEKGPVAFMGGSRVTQPYGNGLLGKAMIDNAFGDVKTLGEIFTLAKKQVLKHEKSALTRQADMMASFQQGPTNLKVMRKDVVRHYNLLGDPALRIRRPASSMKLSREGTMVTIETEAREITLTLESARDKYPHPLEKDLDEDAEDFSEKVTKRYQNANNKVIKSWKIALTDGKATQEIELPEEKGTYFLKAHAPGHVGSLEFKREE